MSKTGVAKGSSKTRIVELLKAQSNWQLKRLQLDAQKQLDLVKAQQKSNEAQVHHIRRCEQSLDTAMQPGGAFLPESMMQHREFVQELYRELNDMQQSLREKTQRLHELREEILQLQGRDRKYDELLATEYQKLRQLMTRREELELDDLVAQRVHL